MLTERQQQTQGINQDVPFTSLDSLARVVAAGASHLGRLHGLAVDDGGAGAFVSAGLVPDLGPQGVLDRLPRAIATPLPIVVMDRSPWGKVVGKHPPLDAAADEIEDGVEDLRRSTDCGRPPGLGLGIRGWTSFHWASVRSVGYFAGGASGSDRFRISCGENSKSVWPRAKKLGKGG